MEKDGSKFLGEVLFQGSILKIYQSEYTNGRPAIFLREDGPPHSILTINLPRSPLEEGEVFVKTWTENEIIAPHVLEHTNLFEDTGRAVDTGFVQADIWRFKKET